MSDENNGAAADTGDSNNENNQNQDSHMIPKSRFDAINAKKNEAIATLESIANELAEDVPEEFKALIPSLPAADKIKWLRQATKSGLFSQKKPDSPDSKRPVKKQAENFSTMNPHELRKAGYKK